MNFKNYDKCFLDYTMSNFGEAFDYANYAYNLSLDQFMQYLFLVDMLLDMKKVI